MEEMLKDKRFAHIAKDPKFRRIPKSERKVKIDKRFQSMFNDKRFTLKYTVDKRGRPVNQTSTENLKKYYDISSSEEDSSKEESKSQDQQSKKKKSKKKKDTKGNDKKITEGTETEESDEGNFSSNGSLLLLNKPTKFVSKKEDENFDYEDIEDQLKIKRPNDKKLDEKVKKKLRDLTIDYARGEGILMSDSSSGEDSSDFESDAEEIEHNWGELDKDAESTDEVTRRLAVCNMDWDRIRASDLMVLFNSFLPTGGIIESITIYPSEFGLQRMKEEEIKGPPELVDTKNEDNSENEDENEEGSKYQMEKLRLYQLNRLKYFYAVIVFDSANTANKVYTECDGLEYESSATKLDLRFIPEDMNFDQESKETCDKMPDLTKYQPRLFTNSALQQVKVDLTWDETNPERQEFTQKLNSGKLDEVDKNDIQAYLASGTSEDESEDELKKQLNNVEDLSENENPIDKYKFLLKSIEEAEEAKKNKDVELEFTWGIGEKEKAEKLVKDKLKKNENLTPFEQFVEKRKEKKKAKKEQRKNVSKDDKNKSDSEDSVPSDIDMNDPYFADELKNTKSKSQKRKYSSKTDDLNSTDDEEKQRQAELELLLMEEDEEESNKRHFSMKRIEEGEILTKSKKKRLTKKKKDIKEEAVKDDFEVDVEDPRFGALFTSHHYNIDPADPHYRKTKGTEALINEKLHRRNKKDGKSDVSIFSLSVIIISKSIISSIKKFFIFFRAQIKHLLKNLQMGKNLKLVQN